MGRGRWEPATTNGSVTSPPTRDVVSQIEAQLRARGFAYFPTFCSGSRGLLKVARALGAVAETRSPTDVKRVLETRPSAAAPVDAPFDRPEAIGWHNDFSTRASRPQLSLAYVERADPRGTAHGAWRAASCRLVLARLAASVDGRRVARFLTHTALPYSFANDQAPSMFRAIERPGRGECFGLRFYGRAMRDGARLVCGSVPAEWENAIRAVETAADDVGVILPAPSGALLVADNWYCLHDRLAQSVDRDLPLRRALLCFVAERHRNLQ